ncbi:N-acetylmuramoyl-L-alanine amidase [Thermoactinospora rubra]|uniref:N-acetylmuramoyl-L-alanine amidase n=1 Tax=Thermoactinospora rubra TaxID=1088767 RepID=UPI000A11ACC8|nr:N-acetylmuramoyl-L-alanine amidase [Thermoactinospora rubra]
MRALPASVAAILALAASACAGTAGGTAARAELPAPPAAKPAAKPAVKPLQGKVVVVDPGHNGGNYRYPKQINRKVNVLTKWKACETTGTADATGYKEATFAWDVSNRLAKILREQGATVKLTRNNDNSWGPCITERAAIGNKAGADAAISVHADGSAPANHGFHVIMPKKIGGPVDPVVDDSRELGIAIRDAYRKITGLPYSTYIGSKALDFRDDLGGLNLSSVPKVFIECGNMRNAQEAAKFRDPEFRQRIAQALATGLENYLK